MSEKRRDNRGRILHNGEAQRADGSQGLSQSLMAKSVFFILI